MRTLILIIVLFASSAYFKWYNYLPSTITNHVSNILQNSQIDLIKPLFESKQIVETHYKNNDLITITEKQIPYLLMEVKFLDEKGLTKEALLLWDLHSGEQVIDTKSWEKTKGMGDCIKADLKENGLPLITYLAKFPKGTSKKHLRKHLQINDGELADLLSKYKRRNLLIENKEMARLHVDKPKLSTIPLTRDGGSLHLTSSFSGRLIAPHYRAREVEKFASHFFGPEFTVKFSREIYLPVYEIIANGEIVAWNSYNGKEYPTTFPLNG